MQLFLASANAPADTASKGTATTAPSHRADAYDPEPLDFSHRSRSLH